MQGTASSTAPLVISNLLLPADLASLNWEKFREGIDICRLCATPEGAVTALLRYVPGAKLQRHLHSGYEHILVLSGSQIDDAGEHLPGTLLIHTPGSTHAIRSPMGCIVLAIWEKPVQFVGDGY